METGAVTSHIDVAQIVLYAFWVFFAGLVFYLQRESRREGYPLVSELDGRPVDHGSIWVPSPKSFLLADGSTVTVPRAEKDGPPPSFEPLPGSNGFAYTPSGDPMGAGVGPGSYTPRADTPDLTHDGHVRIVPLRAVPSYSIEERDADPRGMTVLGADNEQAGEVVDVWLDRSDGVVRYLEVQLPLVSRPRARSGNDEAPSIGASSRVLLPVNFVEINGVGRRILVRAILGGQFAGVPGTAHTDTVTLDEEERICAYYGGGTLYATPQRQEPWL